MELRIALATTVEASPSTVYDVLRSTQGQKGFWTSDCELDDHHGRFGFLEAPVDLNVSISLVDRRARANERRRLVSRVERVDVGVGAERAPRRTANETDVQFRHYDFESAYDEASLAYTAQSWAMILDSLARFIKSGVPDPFFANKRREPVARESSVPHWDPVGARR